MGTINTAALEKGLKMEFAKNYAAMLSGALSYRADVQRVYTDTDSKSASEKYFFLKDYPAVREWLGPKEFAALTDADYTITNKDWETSISVYKNEIEDDQYGAIKQRVALMPRVLIDHKADLLVSLLEDGTTDLAYDAAAFFASRAAPNDNLLAGTGVTAALLQADLGTVRTAMRLFESDNNKKFGLTPDTVIVPAALETAMYEAVFSLSDVDGKEKANPQNKWIESILVLPELDGSDADSWYAACTKFPLRPFIFQTREKPTPYLLDHDVHVNKQLYFTAEGRYNAGYGMFQTCIKVVNT